MEVRTLPHFCENCQKETMQVVQESAFEIEYTCNECGEHEQAYKTFF